MMNESDRIHKELLARIIEAAKDLYGELAIKIASRIEVLEVSGEGSIVKISVPPENVIRNLLCEYETLGGKASKNLNTAILKAYRKQYPAMHFPED